jgi:hypothetical protein
MSRHHMLPPIIFTPPPKPKKIETRKRRLQVGMFDEMDETADTGETNAASASALAAVKPPPAHMPEIESADGKPQGPAGRLSQGMLTELLRAQESKN